jgi:hypothetical protein
MQDLLTMLSQLHRPRLLIRAARLGAPNYRRASHLPRLLGYGTTPTNGPALLRLMELEAEMETRRCEGDAGYLVARHLDLLIAILGEAAQLRALRG